jgi:hypothetical protein
VAHTLGRSETPPRPRGGPGTRSGTALAAALVLAVTAPALAAVPAAAVPAAAQERYRAQAGSRALPALPKRSVVRSAGPTGILTSERYGGKLTWTRLSDGSATELGPVAGHEHGALSDVVALPSDGGTRVTLADMAAGTRTVLDLGALGAGYTYLAAVGRTVLATRATAGGAELHLVSGSGGSVAVRRVTGLPAVSSFDVRIAAAPGAALVGYTSADTGRLAVVDLASAAAVETYRADRHDTTVTAISPTHVAWVERQEMVVAARGPGTVRRVSLDRPDGAGNPVVGLLSGWAVHGEGDDPQEGAHGQEFSALTAVALPGLTGARTVLDRVEHIEPAADGSLLVTGGTRSLGRGIFRIRAGSAGPRAELVAELEKPQRMSFTGSTTPTEAEGYAYLGWTVSPWDAAGRVTFRHTATGASRTWPLTRDPHAERNEQGLYWNGDLGTAQNPVAGPNGRYTWKVVFEAPWNVLAPPLVDHGGLTFRKRPHPHDFDDNGDPDLVARDGAGRLWRQDLYNNSPYEPVVPRPRAAVGGSWQRYDLIESTGLAGRSTGLVARDRSGTLWSHTGGTERRFTSRQRIGGGWGGYRHLAGGSDLAGSSAPDLVAVDARGDVWLHEYRGRTDPATKQEVPSYAARRKIGRGWDIYNGITAVGQLVGGPAGDLLARDRAGVLWLYMGLGDGKYTPRVYIGGGWKQYSHLVGTGDINDDGRPDLYVYGPGGRSYFYFGRNDIRTPFAPRVATRGLLDGGHRYDHVL